MSAVDTYPAWLQPFEPRLPLDRLVVEVNKIFHAFEARDYDRRHPEIHQQLPAYWQEMIAQAGIAPRPGGWRILDFGCGTGFASEQILQHLPAEQITSLVCYDLSPEMVDRCREKIAPQFPAAQFICDAASLAAGGPFDLLLTNSLLHHLPDPQATVRQLTEQLAPGALWLAGHEPSSRYYKNPDCLNLYRRYSETAKSRRGERWWRGLTPAALGTRWHKTLSKFRSPKRLTARAAYKQGLFGRRPTPHVIDRLVDFHVAHSAAEATAGRGFDIDLLQAELCGQWQLRWVHSYSFMGTFAEARLPREWQQECRRLADDFPQDGANLCALWSRAA
ncbi:MAG: hypothetical protein C0483_03090 [Pirellula sp.]|nr:hypothetical protein [Pirellula sp.]